MSWTLEYQGAVESFEAWGISAITRSLVSQDADTVQFIAPARNFDLGPLFAYGATVKIRRDGVLWFTGRVVRTPRKAEVIERQAYVFAGPWWYLDHWEFQQPWYVNIGGFIIQQFTSHLLLNLKPGGALATTTEQITTILDYALARAVEGGLPAPFSKGTIMPSGNGKPAATLYPPIDEVRDLTCGEAIRKMLRWHPSAVTWFDYATDPPTLHIQERDKMASVTLDLASGPDVDLEPREDLQVPAVAIKYEVRSTIDDEEKLSVINDIHPAGSTGRELGALTATIDSIGSRMTTVQAEIVTEPIAAGSPLLADRINWWKARKPDLQSSKVELLDLTVATRPLTSQNLPNELIDGQIAAWMMMDEAPVQAERDTIFAKVTYRVYDKPLDDPNRKVIHDKLEVPISHPCTATNAESGVYSNLESLESADPIPIGLAKYLFDGLAQIQWQGVIKTTQSELAGEVSMGLALNLSGTGNPAYATMLAMVQRIDENLDTGETTIHVGPPPHLSIQDLISLLRVNRNRIRITPPRLPDDGVLEGMGSIRLGKHTPQPNTSHGDGQVKRLRVLSDANSLDLDMTTARLDLSDGTVQVLLDMSDTTWRSKPKRALTVREVAVCVNNELKRMLVLGSDTWDPT